MKERNLNLKGRQSLAFLELLSELLILSCLSLSEPRNTWERAAAQSQLLTGSGLKRPPQRSWPAEMSAGWAWLAGNSEDTMDC